MDSEKKLKNSVFLSVKPLLLLERCYGIFRFKWENNLYTSFNCKMKIIGFLIYLTIAIIYLTFGVGSIAHINFSRSMDIFPRIILFIQYSVTVTVCLFLDGRTNIKIFTVLDDIDAALYLDKNEEIYRKSRAETRILLILIALSIIFMLIYITFDHIINIKFELIFVTMLYCQREIQIALFYKLMGIICQRLTVINNYLSKFITQMVNKKYFNATKLHNVVRVGECYNYIGPINTNNLKIRDLASVYSKIGDVCQMINDTFNFLIITLLFTTFSFIIILFWTSLLDFQSYRSLRYLIRIVIWTSSEIIKVIIIVYNCEKLLNVKQETNLLINKIVMNYHLPKRMRVQAKVFIQTMEAWQLRVCVYDMISIDLQMIFKFLSLCVTYLIVVIQVTHCI
ncbi:uncharacterized protein [Battus philenor]|uniref:uncharacterized protein n=1 Tax=Battus philenor TaxID=42288 RepID=UPI0035CE926C